MNSSSAALVSIHRTTNPDGSLDAGFGTGGKVRTSFGDLNGAALQADGRIVAAGFQATRTPKSVQFAVSR